MSSPRRRPAWGDGWRGRPADQQGGVAARRRPHLGPSLVGGGALRRRPAGVRVLGPAPTRTETDRDACERSLARESRPCSSTRATSRTTVDVDWFSDARGSSTSTIVLPRATTTWSASPLKPAPRQFGRRRAVAATRAQSRQLGRTRGRGQAPDVLPRMFPYWCTGRQPRPPATEHVLPRLPEQPRRRDPAVLALLRLRRRREQPRRRLRGSTSRWVGAALVVKFSAARDRLRGVVEHRRRRHRPSDLLEGGGSADHSSGGDHQSMPEDRPITSRPDPVHVDPPETAGRRPRAVVPEPLPAGAFPGGRLAAARSVNLGTRARPAARRAGVHSDTRGSGGARQLLLHVRLLGPA